MKKIAIIGANSYIARNLIYYIKKQCPTNILLLYDREETQLDGEKNYEKVNIFDEKSVDKIDFTCNVIFMFVGKTGSINGFDDFNTFLDINEKALINLLNAYRRANSKSKIIFPSTRLVYKGKKALLKEDAEKEFKTIYAINKYACENYLKQYNNVFNIQYCIFRICVPYGTMIPEASSYGTADFMIRKATGGENISLYGDGSVRRTIIYMGHLCKVLFEGAISDECCNDVFNIGGENYSLREMAELIANKYKIGIDYVPYPDVALKIESGDTVFDDEKLQKIVPMNYEGKFKQWLS